ncbi:MAG: hypothetical protein ACKVWV_12770 [Planctomycetota bacterium]
MADRLRLLRTETPSLTDRAIEDVRFIRRTMERAAALTVVPGWGGVLMGAVALVAAPIAAHAETSARWLGVWIGAAALALLIGASDMIQKVRANESALLRGPAWRFAASLVPAFFTAACLTLVLFRAGASAHLPGLWLSLYGVGVIAAGTYSIAPVRWVGASFLFTGTCALLAPALGDWFMAFGFGGLHVGFGVWIARHHGG